MFYPLFLLIKLNVYLFKYAIGTNTKKGVGDKLPTPYSVMLAHIFSMSCVLPTATILLNL